MNAIMYKSSSNDVFNKAINGVRECKWCHQKFENITGSQFANHVRWCKQNPNRSKGFKEKLQAFAEKEQTEKYGPYLEFEVQCANPKCTNKVIVHERAKKFPEKEHYFCCSHCAHSYSAQKVDPEKIKCGRKQFDLDHPGFWSKDNAPIIKETRFCLWCNNEFITTTKKNKKFCCVSCASKYREFQDFQQKLNLSKDDYEKTQIFLRKYRLACAFTFSMKSFPDEFNFLLIEKYGWYAAKNHGNNLNGISRDHMFSVKDGFLQFINPIFISHPANCRLIKHTDNISKLDKSLFDKQELLNRILIWDQKYGKFYSVMNYEDINTKFDWEYEFTHIC